MLELEAISTASGVAGASLTVRRGEVVGIAGLVGCGTSDVMRAAFGADRLTGGTVRFRGRQQQQPRPSAMWRAGFFYL
ncbi:ATP-binding cassette domain-containing protein, partial [Acinetobacter baumannii]